MDDVAERLTPAEAFSLVGHELRFRTLDELSRADRPLAFSELRKRVGVEDPGQFNYHLGRLTGRFVRDEGDGYTSTMAGDRVVGAVLSGGLTKTLDVAPVDLDADCSECGAPLAMRFTAGRAVVVCDDCGYTVFNLALPAGVLEDSDREDRPDVVDRWYRQRLSPLDEGFCLHCAGPIDLTVLPEGGPATPAWVDERAYGAAVRFACGRCESEWLTSVAPVLLRRPAVVAFYYDHGVRERDVPAWEDTRAPDSEGRVVSRDPLRVAVRFHCEGDELDVTVDEALRVVDVERG